MLLEGGQDRYRKMRILDFSREVNDKEATYIKLWRWALVSRPGSLMTLEFSADHGDRMCADDARTSGWKMKSCWRASVDDARSNDRSKRALSA